MTESPSTEARDHLKAILHPRQIVYLVTRYTSRSGSRAEVGVFIVEAGLLRELSAEVATALLYVLGPRRGVLLRVQKDRDQDHEVGAYVVHWLSQLCGFGSPETALRYEWL